MLAGLFDPHACGDAIAHYTQMQRAAASAEAASIFLELDLSADLRDLLPRVAVPALVLHRRGDRTVPIGRGRELASLLPNARFVPLTGDSHLPWRDDQRELFRALAGFLYSEAAPALDGSVAAHLPRDGGASARLDRHVEPGDRLDARAQRAHGAPPRGEHPAQAVAVDPGERGDARHAGRAHLTNHSGATGGGRWRRRAVAPRLSHAGL